jgi:hypothetical protein
MFMHSCLKIWECSTSRAWVFGLWTWVLGRCRTNYQLTKDQRPKTKDQNLTEERKLDVDNQPAASRVVRLDRPVVQPHHAVGDGEPETRAIVCP